MFFLYNRFMDSVHYNGIWIYVIAAFFVPVSPHIEPHLSNIYRVSKYGTKLRHRKGISSFCLTAHLINLIYDCFVAFTGSIQLKNQLNSFRFFLINLQT